jgi:hypothetical protein
MRKCLHGGLQVVLKFTERFGGQPHIVVIAANLWDIMWWSKNDAHVTHSEGLSGTDLELWTRKARKAFRTVQVRATVWGCVGA